jgi:hypothetical protein
MQLYEKSNAIDTDIYWVCWSVGHSLIQNMAFWRSLMGHKLDRPSEKYINCPPTHTQNLLTETCAHGHVHKLVCEWIDHFRIKSFSLHHTLCINKSCSNYCHFLVLKIQIDTWKPVEELAYLIRVATSDCSCGCKKQKIIVMPDICTGSISTNMFIVLLSSKCDQLAV